jgi:uncharacterized protein YgiB involved in biofilm formation
MKRTRTTRLLLMGLTPFVLSACDLAGGRQSTDAEYLFPNAEACVQSGQYSAEDCQAAFQTAWNEHEATAPRYPSEQACSQQHGSSACIETQDATGSSSFIPFMAGMLMGRAFNTGFARPAYYGRDRSVMAGNGQYWRGGSNPMDPQRTGTGNARALPPPPSPGRVVTQSRSGFGHSHAMRGGAGS